MASGRRSIGGGFLPFSLPTVVSSIMSHPTIHDIASIVTPLLYIAIPLLGITVAYSIVKNARAPSWFPGITDLDKVGTRVAEIDHEDEATVTKVNVDQVKEYDVIIVGGGTAGCALASRLSESPQISVLLLEAGHSSTLQLFSRIPATFSQLFRSKVDYNYWTAGKDKASDGAKGVKGRELQWPRARMLGGCSAINAMMCHHCSPSDFDEWDQLTSSDSFWSYSNMLPYLTRSQTLNHDPTWPHSVQSDKGSIEKLRGSKGPVNVGYSKFESQMSRAFIKSAETIGIKVREDINTDGDYKHRGQKGSDGTLGVSRTQSLIHDGSRVTSATSYLTPDVVARSNLTIAVGATTTKILFDPTTLSSTPKAIGVEFIALDSAFPVTEDEKVKVRQQTKYQAIAKKDVIICAGTIGSPHLLKVSGVGPKLELEKLGIKVIKQLEGVGKNLKDHTISGIYLLAQPGTSIQWIAHPVKGLTALIEWLRYKTGPLTTQIAEVLALVRTDDEVVASKTGIPKPDLEDTTSLGKGPDIELIHAPMGFAKHGTVQPNPKHGADFYSIGAILLRPKSSGEVLITSKDIWEKPIIDAKILSDENDLKTLIWGVKLCYAMTKAKPLSDLLIGPYDLEEPDLTGKPNLWPKFPNPDKLSDDELGEMIRGAAETIYHPVGTVKMGKSEKENACLEPKTLKVFGVKNLRVIDASIFPEQLSGHPMAPLFAIAEKMSDEIKKEYRL